MASGDIALRLLVTGSAAGAIAEFTKMAASAMSVQGVMATIGVAGAAAVVGIGVAAVKAAGDFQGGMERLVTSAGESQSALKSVGDGILKISVDTGTSTDQLSAAMYKIESSGAHGADGLKVLTAASQGAKTENADLATVTQALLGVMQNYHMPAGDATKAMDGLVAVVKNGNTTLQDLSGSMSQVLPVAASLGISFAQVGGAVDTMTSKTMPAQQAAQNLAHVLVALSAPSAVATKSMALVGLSAQQVKDALANQGLVPALQLIEDHVGQKFPAGSVAGETALKNIMGGLVGLKLAAQLTGPSLQATQNNVDAITAAMKNGSGAVDGFAQIQGTLNFQLDRVKQAMNALLITIGQGLLPILTPIISGFANFVSGLIKFMSTGAGVTTVVVALSTAVAGLLVLVGGALKGAFTSAIASLLGTAAATTADAVASDAAAKSATELSVALKMVAISSASMAMATGVDAGTLAAASAAYDAAAVAATADATATAAAVAPTVALGAAIWTALAPILPFIIAGAALVGVLILLYKNCEPFRQAVNTLVSDLKKFWDIIAGQIGPALKNLADTIGNELNNQWQNLVATWNSQLKPALQQLWEALKPLLPILEDLAVGAIAILIAAIYTLVVVLKIVIVVITDVVKILSDDLYAAVRIVTGVIQVLAGILSFLADLVTGHWSKLKDDLGTIGQGIQNIIGGIIGNIQAQIDDLTGMFGDVGKAIGDALGPPLQQFGSVASAALGNFFSTQSAGIQAGLKAWAGLFGGFFQDLGTGTRSGLDMTGGLFGGFFSNLGSGTQSGLKMVSDLFQSFFSSQESGIQAGLKDWAGLFSTGINAIGGFFSWFYQHNYYVKDFIDSQTAGIQAGLKAWGGLFSTFFSTQSAGIQAGLKAWKDVFSSGFQSITAGTQAGLKDWAGLFQNFFSSESAGIQAGLKAWKDVFGGFFQDLGTGTQDGLQMAGGFFSDFFSKESDGIQAGLKAWAGLFGGFFQDLGTGTQDGIQMILDKFGEWIPQLADFFNKLNQQAFQWGANIISNIIQGIGSMFSALGSAANDAAGVIAKFLGFHSPTKEGPGSTADLWAPALVSMLSRGLVQGVPQIRSASMQLAGGIASAFAVNSGAFAVPGALGAGSNQPGTMNIITELDGNVLMRTMNVRQAKEVRIQGGYRHG